MPPRILDRKSAGRDPVTATVEERAAIARIVSALITDEKAECLIGPSGSEARLPRPLRLLLLQGAAALLEGRAVLATPLDKELTTNEAARLLNVSRPYLYRLLDEGQIPYTLTGTHRRIKLRDLLSFCKRRDATSREALAELSRLSQEYGLYEAER